MPYSKILVTDLSKIISISVMHVYLYKNYEELRWEDYRFNNAGVCLTLQCIYHFSLEQITNLYFIFVGGRVDYDLV